MARTNVVKTTPLGSGSAGYATANAADLTMVACSGSSGSNGNMFLCGGKDLVVAHNTGGSPYTITITSVADPFGRTGDVAAYTLGAGEYAIFGPFETTGWRQTDGYIYLESNNVAVKFGVISL